MPKAKPSSLFVSRSIVETRRALTYDTKKELKAANDALDLLSAILAVCYENANSKFNTTEFLENCGVDKGASWKFAGKDT